MNNLFSKCTTGMALKNENVKLIINKYLNGTISKSELESLSLWLQKPKHQVEFKAYLRDLGDTYVVLQDIDLKTAYDEIHKTINRHNKPIRRLLPNWAKYAAAVSIVLLISHNLIFNKDKGQVTEPIIVNNNIERGTNKAILTLEDGSNIALGKGRSYTSNTLKINGVELVYSTANKTISEITYNYLTIPRGGQFQIALSDGTKVWLNSESKLKYPVAFINGRVREVELIYGEAYFDVSHSINHNGDNFKVIHSTQEIQVVGTEFNIKAYRDEQNVYTTLVEGSVFVNDFVNSVILKSGQQSVLNSKNKNFSISEVDTFDETSWKRGVFNFKMKSLEEICVVLERWYNVNIILKNKSLRDKKFLGSLDKNQSINEILDLIKKTNQINDYTINDNIIVYPFSVH